MTSDVGAAADDGRNLTNRLQLQAAHPLHHPENHPLAFINSLDTRLRHFMISLQDFSDPSISSLLFRSTGFFDCIACSTATPGGPSFHCLSCPFSLSAACAALPLITVDDHPHPLLLLNRNTDHKHLICAVCDEGISSTIFVRCVYCDAFLHVECSLPPVIKAHNHHVHPIVLSIVDGDTNLCGVCGEEKDGASWFYRCQICTFLAHVDCVIYDHQIPSEKECEDQASLTTQLCALALDDDEHNLDEEGSHESTLKPGVTIQQIIDSFSESDDVEYQTLATAIIKAAGGDSGDDDDDDDNEPENETNSEEKHMYRFWNLEKPLYDLLDKLELEDADPFEGCDRNSPTVLVGGQYLVVEKLAETFNKVFTKHGDISESSNMSIKVKTIVWNLFCHVIDDISRMEFEKMTGEDLVSWMIGIRTIQLAGFDVEFAYEGWKKIAMAFFGVRAKEVAQDLVEEVEEKIKEQRLKLEELCEEQEKLLSLRQKCVLEALAMERKYVGDGFI